VWIISRIRNSRKISLASTQLFLLLALHHWEQPYTFQGQTKPLAIWHWTVLLNNAQMGLGALGKLQLRSRGGNDLSHILAFCSTYHPPKRALGLVTLDDDTVDWLQKTALSI